MLTETRFLSVLGQAGKRIVFEVQGKLGEACTSFENEAATRDLLQAEAVVEVHAARVDARLVPWLRLTREGRAAERKIEVRLGR